MRELPTISACICTSGRPAELRRCLLSLANGTKIPSEAVVADDSTDSDSATAVRDLCEEFAFARYVTGPKRGLCANRNAVIAAACGSHVALLDDDAVARPDFVETAQGLAAQEPVVVWTGDVWEKNMHRQRPTNPRFLGHFGEAVGDDETLRNINLNCNVIPREVFRTCRFDEGLTYGYEDTDLCAQLLAAGYQIRRSSMLTNEHHPPRRTAQQAAQVAWMAERARFTTTLTRHLRWQRNLRAATGFALLAPAHLSAWALLHGRPKQALAGWWWIIQDTRRLLGRQKRVDTVAAAQRDEPTTA